MKKRDSRSDTTTRSDAGGEPASRWCAAGLKSGDASGEASRSMAWLREGGLRRRLMRVPAVKAATMTGRCVCKSMPRDIGDGGEGGEEDVQSGSARFLNCGTILPADEAGTSLVLFKTKYRYTQTIVKSDNDIHGEEPPPVLEHEGNHQVCPRSKRTREKAERAGRRGRKEK